MAPPHGFFGAAFDRGFDRFRDGLWPRCSRCVLRHALFVLVSAPVLAGDTGGARPNVIGTDFFPTADVGIIKLHFRAPPGTRIEETEKLVLQVEDKHPRDHPARASCDTINDTVGVPLSYNLAFVPTDNVGSMDAEILISLDDAAPAVDRLHARDPRPAARRVSRQPCSISRPPTS